MRGKDFLAFMKYQLLPKLERNDILVLDNLNIHKSRAFKRLVAEYGVKILMLPRYSPDLNPIEAAWAKMKHLVRKSMPQTVAELRVATRAALRKILPSDIQGWFRYCGYKVHQVF